MLALGGLRVKHAVQSGILLHIQHLLVLQDRGKPPNTLTVLADRRTLRMKTDF
jgi:hypothetical protein